MREYDSLIENHYKKIAINHGKSGNSTIKDPEIRSAELSFLKTEIEDYARLEERSLKILDVGCGNGYTLQFLLKHFPNNSYYGVDITRDLIKIAKESSEKILFHQADCRESQFFDQVVDIVITERALINILHRKDQIKAMENIARIIKPGGLYLMIESFIDPFVRLNCARRQNKLEPITVSSHNRYISEKTINVLSRFGLTRKKTILPENYLSTHFFNTRVLHPLLRPEGGKVECNEIVKFLNLGFGPAVGDYSPIKFYAFKKTR